MLVYYKTHKYLILKYLDEVDKLDDVDIDDDVDTELEVDTLKSSKIDFVSIKFVTKINYDGLFKSGKAKTCKCVFLTFIGNQTAKSFYNKFFSFSK